MENCLLQYYILNDELRDSCDFNPQLLARKKGIYEVFRVINGVPLFLDEHISRFYQSADIAKLTIPLANKKLKKSLQTLIEANRFKTGNIRFQYQLLKETGPIFMAWVTPAIYPTMEQFKEGVEISSLDAFRKNPHAKRANLPVRFKAEEIIEKDGVAEVLLINKDKLVTECHRSNIFFVSGETLYTPSIELVLPGITRHKIIDLAIKNQIHFIERNILADELENFDACFLSSTSKNVLSVRKLDAIHYKVSDTTTGKLSVLYDEFIAQHLKTFKWD